MAKSGHIFYFGGVGVEAYLTVFSGEKVGTAEDSDFFFIL